MSRIFALIIGYLLGIIQTGYIYGRMKNIDIRQYGSGNVGTTNVKRVLGKKASIITYIVDCLKAIVAAVIVHFCFGIDEPDMDALLICYAGLGTILGHNFPFYLKFNGGKGIATSSGLIFSLIPYNPWLTVFGFLTFFSIKKITRYVSLASLILMTTFAIEFIISGWLGYFNLEGAYQLEADIIVIIMAVLAFVRHKSNIVRLLNGTERKS